MTTFEKERLDNKWLDHKLLLAVKLPKTQL